jgi:hypothetical protein
VVLDPIDEYIKPKKQKLLMTYNSDVNMSTNINPNIYDRKRFGEILKNESNELERLWKSRILHESTPRGPVIMYYDIYKQGFAYYSDQNGIPYSILNAVAMKYVITFLCRDLFFDEITITTEKLSPLVKIFNEEEKKVKAIPDKEGQPFAKLRNYKNTANAVQQLDKGKDKEADANKEKERPKLKNKFISLGKIYNFSVLQKVPKNKPNIPTRFDGMLSYKDYKNKVNSG